jgi:N-acetylneuraminic acid mutarotase
MKYPAILLFTCLFSVSAFAQWTLVSSPPTEFRTHHSFAFSIDGTGYIVTGYAPDGELASAYSYSPDIDEWTQLSDFPGGTRNYGIGDVWEGKAYFGFGTGISPGSTFVTTKRDLWVFDPSTQTWTERAECPCIPRTHPGFVVHQGNIYMGLGGGVGVGNMKDWWQYNIASDTWTQKADFPSHPRHHPYQFTIGDYVYVGFGHGSIAPEIYNTWYRYDPSNDSWLQVADLPAEGRVAGTQFSHNGYGYVLSGEGENHGSMDSGEFWKYDADGNSWEELPPHPGPSRWAPASFIIDDEVYLINGTAFGDFQAETYKYNLADSSSGAISQNNSQLNLQLYPNPFSNQITLDLEWDELPNLEVVHLKVFDLLGVLVHEAYLEANSSHQILGHLRTGSYLLEFYNEETKIASRSVIKSL